jgi:hypothetical protein
LTIQGLPIKPDNWREMCAAQIEGLPIPAPDYGGRSAAPAIDRRQPGDDNYTNSDTPAGRSKVRYSAAASYGSRRNWQSGGGFSKPGIGERPTDWPSFSATSRFGTANPTCATCGGRMRGAKRCTCEMPEWKPIGKRRNEENEGLPDDMTGGGMQRHLSAMQDWHYRWAVEALRVAKPGAHMLVFGGTRTHHRLMCAIEDAGWEIRDTIAWVFGSGFPKSLDVSKAIDKAAGAEREVLGPNPCARPNHDGERIWIGDTAGKEQSHPPLTAPATDDAKQWSGWGTSLKPAWEMIVVARKPLSGTVASNVLRYGTGAINIDACRVPTEESLNGGAYAGGVRPTSAMGCEGEVGGTSSMLEAGGGRLAPEDFRQPEGRWPANLIHDGSDEVLAGFPETSSHGGGTSSTGFWQRDNRRQPIGAGDTGSAARFFYCAKSSRAERNEGLSVPVGGGGGVVANNHPT